MRFYFDEHMPRPVARALEQRGHDALMAIDSDMLGKDDDTEHLAFAAEHEAVLVTHDKAFAGRTMKRTDHAGLICWTGAQDDFGGMIEKLHAFGDTHTQEEAAGQVFWIK